MEYLDKFWEETNNYKTQVKPKFCLPPQKSILLSEIITFLDDYRLSSTDVKITVACDQLEKIIKKSYVIIDVNFAEGTKITNPYKTKTIQKAIKKGELSLQRKVS